jgi:excisionase family DNA binding protein
MTDLAAKVDLPLMLTVVDIQKHLQVSQSQAYAMLASGELPCVHIGKLVRVPRAAFLDFINRGIALAV